jgi:hypothetical protein
MGRDVTYQDLGEEKDTLRILGCDKGEWVH